MRIGSRSLPKSTRFRFSVVGNRNIASSVRCDPSLRPNHETRSVNCYHRRVHSLSESSTGQDRRDFISSKAVPSLGECPCCGSQLQTDQPAQPGYVPATVINKTNSNIEKLAKKTGRAFRSEANLSNDRLLSQLDPDSLRLLTGLEKKGYASATNDPSKEVVNEEEEVPDLNLLSLSYKEKHPELIKSTGRPWDTAICSRCHDLIHRDNFQLRNLPYWDEVMKQIPHESVCVHVMDINDFPLSRLIYNSNNFKLASADRDLKNVLPPDYNTYPDDRFRKVIHVINRADLYCKDPRLAHERISGYIRRYMRNVPSNSIFVVSAQRGWRSTDLYKLIDRYNKVYFVGYANVGKSELIRRLQYHAYSSRKTNPRGEVLSERPFPKYVPGMSEIPVTHVLPQGRKFIEMPGFRPVPRPRILLEAPALIRKGTTQVQIELPEGTISDELARKAQSLDKSTLSFRPSPKMPAIALIEQKKLREEPHEGNLSLYEYIKHEHIKRIAEGPENKSQFRAIVSTSRHGQVIYYGGIFAISCENSRITTWNSIGLKPHLTSSIERARELIEVQEKNPNVDTVVQESASDHLNLAGIIHVDGGGSELVVQGCGSVDIRIVGKIPADGIPIKVWALDGLRFATRAPIWDSLRDRMALNNHKAQNANKNVSDAEDKNRETLLYLPAKSS